jgi:hypothetical protein
MADLSPGARSLLRAADTCDDPSPADAARVRREVLTRVGAMGVTAAVVTVGSSQAKAASVISIAAKLTAALAITAGGVAVTLSYVSHDRELAIRAPSSASAQPAKPPAPAPAATIVTPEEGELEETAPVTKAPRAAARRAPPPPEKVQSNAAALEAEMKLIRGADAALRAGRASAALSLLAEHQAGHPRASLAHEREGLRAIANCQLAAAGSSSAAERFLTHSPHSPLAPRLRIACRISR